MTDTLLADAAERLRVRDVELEVVRRGTDPALLFFTAFTPRSRMHASSNFCREKPLSWRRRTRASAARRGRRISARSTTSFISTANSRHPPRRQGHARRPSFGGWLAAEIAVKAASARQAHAGRRARHQGERPRDARHTRRVQHPSRQGSPRSWHDPEASRPDFDEMEDDELTPARATGRRSAATACTLTCTTRSSSAGSAASRADAGAVGRIRRRGQPAYGEATRTDSRRALRLDRARRASSRDRAAGSVRRARARLPRSDRRSRPAKGRAMEPGTSAKYRIPTCRRTCSMPPIGAREPAQPLLRPASRRRSVRGDDRRVPAVRRAGPEHRRHRASCRHQLAARRESDAGRDTRAPDAEGAHPESRHAGHAAPDPVRIAEEYATADVISRGRLEIGFVKSGGSEMASGNVNLVRQRRALLGSDRPHLEGADLARRAVQLGGQALHPPAREHLAAPVSAAAAAHVVGDRRSAHLRRSRPSRHGAHAGVARPRRHASRVCGKPPRARGGRAAAVRRPRISPTRRSCLSAKRKRKACRVGEKMLWFLNTSLKSAPQYRKFLPGVAPPQAAPMIYRTKPQAAMAGAAQARQRREGRRRRRRQKRGADGIDRRKGDGAGHPVRRQPRHRLQADHGSLRLRRRLRPSRDDRPLRLHDACGDREEHQSLRQGSAAAPQGDRAVDTDLGGSGDERRRPAIDPELVAAGALLRERGLVALNPSTSPLGEARAALEDLGVPQRGFGTAWQRARSIIPAPRRESRADSIGRTATPARHSSSTHMAAALRSASSTAGTARCAILSAQRRRRPLGRLRLAPEHRFPAAFNEWWQSFAMCLKPATRWRRPAATCGRRRFGRCQPRTRRGAGVARCRRVAAAFPAAPLRRLFDGWRQSVLAAFGTGAYGLSRAQLDWVWCTYLGHPEQKKDWRVAPLLAPLAGLPPAHLAIGTLDPLLDDNERLAESLAAAGVPCRLVIYEGLDHGFIRYGRLVGSVRRAIADSASALRKGLITARAEEWQ